MKLSEMKAALTRHRGIAMKNQYRVDISPPATLEALALDSVSKNDLNIFAESFTLPDRTIETFDWGIWNHTIKIPKGYTETGIDITFVATNDFFIKNFFDNWVSLVVNEETYLVSYPAEIKGSIKLYYTQNEISAINAKNNADTSKVTENERLEKDNRTPIEMSYREIRNYGIEILGAYPTGVKNIELNAADDTPAKVIVSFTFDRFQKIALDTLNNA
jgi:hypothetical protein